MFLLVFGAAMGLTSWVSYQAFVQTHQEDFDSMLYNHAVDVASFTSVDLLGILSSRLYAPEDLEKRFPFSLQTSFMQIRDSSGRVIGKSSNLGAVTLPIGKADLPALRTQGYSLTTIQAGDLPSPDAGAAPEYRLISYVVRKAGIPGLILQIAAPMNQLDHSKARFLRLLALIFPGALLIAAFLGFGLSRRALQPVRSMTEKTAEIQLQSLKERLPVPTGDFELSRLALTLNQMLDRIEGAVSAQERFVSDASHQIQTPLAIMRGEIELQLQESSLPEGARAALGSILQETLHLSRLGENLLTLARMDAGQGILELRTVRLDELLLDLVSKLDPWARRQGIRIESELAPFAGQREEVIDFEVRGDPTLLSSLLQNLLENAVKYSPRDGLVKVRLSETERSCVFEVEDQGGGISKDELDRIFERFFRNSKAAVTTRGFGLGLAIAKRIAELHQGSLTVESRAGKGTIFRFEIKKN